MNKKNKSKWYRRSGSSVSAGIKFYICLTVGCIFAAIGIYCPPLGEIDNSVLVLVGELLVLAGAVLGIDLPSVLQQNRNKKYKKEEEDE